MDAPGRAHTSGDRIRQAALGGVNPRNSGPVLELRHPLLRILKEKNFSVVKYP